MRQKQVHMRVVVDPNHITAFLTDAFFHHSFNIGEPHPKKQSFQHTHTRTYTHTHTQNTQHTPKHAQSSRLQSPPLLYQPQSFALLFGMNRTPEKQLLNQCAMDKPCVAQILLATASVPSFYVFTQHTHIYIPSLATASASLFYVFTQHTHTHIYIPSLATASASATGLGLTGGGAPMGIFSFDLSALTSSFSSVLG